MKNIKSLVTWLVLCAAAAGGTIFAVQMLNKPLSLQQKVATFGKIH